MFKIILPLLLIILTPYSNFLLVRGLDEKEVEYYTNIVDDTYESATTYILPTNAEEHRPEFHKILTYFHGSYDYVVIGLGSGGTVVANRLSENKNSEVLALEAGSFGNAQTDIPNMYFPLEFSKFNWGYNTTSQKNACLGMVDHQCPIPRGKGVGGTTLINGLVYSRGHETDFDRWASMGNPGWSYKEVLPYFKKSENFNHNDEDARVDPTFHGRGGYLNVEYHKPKSPQLKAFLKGAQDLGYKLADYNANELGVSQSQLNTINGQREDGGRAFIRPILNRKNLKVLTRSYVKKIKTEREEAVGVYFSWNNRSYYARARKEVILCAGAINSPQILMLSGIGPKEHLKKLNIPIVADLEVGSALKDHPTFYGLTFHTNYTEPVLSTREYVKQFLEGGGPLTVPGSNQGVGFFESSFTKGTGIPDFELMFIPSNATSPSLSQKAFRLTDETYEDLWKNIDVPNSFNYYVIGLHANSEGTVRLKSKNPYDYPIIDSRFLSDPENRDIDILYEALQTALKITETEPFKAINATLQGGPLRACKAHEYKTKNYWYCALRQMTMNLYHPVSTCPMGPDPKKGAVVDSKLRVYGVKGLRVCDASVFPFTLAGHPNAPAVLVGEKCADYIKQT